MNEKNLIAFDASGNKFTSSAGVQAPPSKEESAASILIGPEGGWSEREINLFKEKNIPIYSLGNLTLRAETAAIAATSLLQL